MAESSCGLALIEGVMLNLTQRRILAAAGALMVWMLLFPPFVDNGGLFGRVQFAFLLTPPTPINPIAVPPAVDADTLLLQITAIACSALAAALALDDRSTRAAMRYWKVGAFFQVLVAVVSLALSVASPDRGWTGAPLLFCLLPVHLPGGYFLFWLRVAALALLSLLAVTLAGRGSKRAVPINLVAAVTGAAFGLVVVSAVMAALR
jgi:hypothetical protein